MGSFNKASIQKLAAKLKSKTFEPQTEEATKQWLIMPLIIALGYDPYSNDVIPEYTMDVGVKKGEKVDYALQIGNQPVVIVECKQLGVALSNKLVSQLYRYFSVSDVHIAILTNGDDYWFFTDSEKENVMDLEPYFRIKLSEATDEELDKLESYSQDKIQYLDIVQEVQYERFQKECIDLVKGLRNNSVPSWLLDALSERSGLSKSDRPILSSFLWKQVCNEFRDFKDEEKPKEKKVKQDKENKKSDIKLNHEYIYNDFSDGDWLFHTLDYAIILGRRFDEINGHKLLLNVFTELLESGNLKLGDIVDSEAFSKTYRISYKDDFRGAYKVEKYNVYIGTSYSILGITKFIQKLLEAAGLPDDSVIVSFKD